MSDVNVKNLFILTDEKKKKKKKVRRNKKAKQLTSETDCKSDTLRKMYNDVVTATVNALYNTQNYSSDLKLEQSTPSCELEKSDEQQATSKINTFINLNEDEENLQITRDKICEEINCNYKKAFCKETRKSLYECEEIIVIDDVEGALEPVARDEM